MDPPGSGYAALPDCQLDPQACVKAPPLKEVLLEEFYASKHCCIQPGLAWNPSIILSNLSCLPRETDINRLKRLLERTKECEKLLSGQTPQDHMHAIIARARSLKGLPLLVEGIHHRYSMFPQSHSLATERDLMLPRTRKSSSRRGLYASKQPTKSQSHPVSFIIEQGAREWTEEVIQQKCKELNDTTYEQVRSLSTAVTDQISAIWVKQHKTIGSFKKEQFRICNLALLGSLKMAILERIKEVVKLQSGDEAHRLISLDVSSSEEERSPKFHYSLCGLESASEQDSCSSSSEELAHVPVESSGSEEQIPEQQPLNWRWNQSIVLRLIMEVPTERDFSRLEKLMQITDAYEFSLSERMQVVDLEEIKHRADKFNALALLIDRIYSRLYPCVREGLALEIDTQGESPENHGSLLGLELWMAKFSFRKKPKSSLLEGSSFWSLPEMLQKIKGVALGDKNELVQLAKIAQDQVSCIWTMQYKAIQQMEREQYRIANLALLCGLKFTIMEQMKISVLL